MYAIYLSKYLIYMADIWVVGRVYNITTDILGLHGGLAKTSSLRGPLKKIRFSRDIAPPPPRPLTSIIQNFENHFLTRNLMKMNAYRSKTDFFWVFFLFFLFLAFFLWLLNFF